jgi:glycosyltransferase involved in cell wall biosynthesis
VKKVVQFYRAPLPGQFSIEQVFSPLKVTISKQFELEEYYCDLKKNRFQQTRDASKHQGNVNHITGDVHFLALGLPSKNTVLTIHDLFHYQYHLGAIRKKVFKVFWVDKPIRKVKTITTISNYTKEKIVELTGCPPEKIRVIHNSTSDDLTFCPKQFNSERPTILQIGDAPHKNAKRLIEAVRGLSCKIVFIRGTLDRDLIEKLRKYKIDYLWHSNLKREEVINEYQKCDILFFASEMEGFGVPIIEANQTGRPVITSKVTSMPEIAGEAALFVNPFSVDEIRNALVTLTNSKDLRNRLIENGKLNCERFSANLIAQKYCSLYFDIINS